jgi:hypothetical protein
MEIRSRDIPSFSGSFHRFKIRISSNQEKGTQEYFVVLSKGKRHAFSKYLWYKFLYDNLTKQEEMIFYSLPEILNSEFRIQALRAILRKGKKEIRNRIEELPLIPDSERVSYKTYQGLRGNTQYDLSLRVGKLPKPPKFSGWIKNSSSKDRKSSSKGSVMDPLNIILEDFVEEKKFDWFLYLTVGTVPPGPPGQIGYLSLTKLISRNSILKKGLFLSEPELPPSLSILE